LYATLTPGDQIPDNFLWNLPYIDKIIHLGLFFIQGILLLKSSERFGSKTKRQYYKIILVLIIGTVFAIFVETFQILIPYRSFDTMDLLANFTGLLLGTCIYLVTNN
jgi:VanZ family protein